VTGAQVRALLDAYEPLPGEIPIVADFLELLETSAPFDRSQFDPGHVTASGFVLSPDRSSLLLIEHRRLGRWLQPGGHIDLEDSTVERAARREIEEETGVGELTALVPGLFGLNHHPIPARGAGQVPEPAHRHFDLKFAFVAGNDEVVVSAEVVDASWVALEEVPALGVDEETLHELAKLATMI